MSGGLFDDMVVPVPEPAPEVVEPQVLADNGGALPELSESMNVTLGAMLPDGFNLRALLTFVPDVRLKHKVEALAEQARTIDVSTDLGLRRADAVRDELKGAIRETTDAFKLPCDLSNQLHKRMTGLRADFVKTGEAAEEALTERILKQQKENARAAELQRQKDQAEADKQAKERAKEAAELAKAEGAPKAVVKELVQQAKTATAPPVPVASSGTLKRSNVAAKWRCRPVGSEEDDEPNPEMGEATPKQLEGIRALMQACLDGHQPMTVFAVQWSVLNARAANEKKAMRIHGMEAVDVGKLVSRRKR